MRRRRPNMQKHAHNHTQRRTRQIHDGHLPGENLQETGFPAASFLGAALLAVCLGEQAAEVGEAVAVRREAV